MNMVLTCFSLLMPAFSLPYAPELLPVSLHRILNAPLPIDTFVSIPWLRPRYVFRAESLDQ